MSEIRDRVFKTLEEAKPVCRDKESVFKCTDAAVGGRTVYVAARTHPLARAAAALYWGVSCTTMSEARAANVDADSMVAEMTPEKRKEVMALLKKMEEGDATPTSPTTETNANETEANVTDTQPEAAEVITEPVAEPVAEPEQPKVNPVEAARRRGRRQAQVAN